MDLPLLTIAVAVYNTGKYLKGCMDSVVNQTYQNLEIICVNDCSTDDSLEILEEYATKDKRIKIISNEKNFGLGVTRNVGMDAAHGEYILFIDSDDWLDLTTCEKLISKAKKNDADAVFYSACVVDGNKKRVWKKFCDGSCFSYPLDIEGRRVLLRNPYAQTWSRLLKLKFLREKGIRFPDFRFIEDEKPHWMVCLLATKVEFEPEHLYYYRVHKGQLTRCTDKRRMLVIDVFNEIEEYLSRKNIYFFYRKELLERKFRSCFYSISNLDDRFREEFLRKVKISLSDKFFLLTQYKPLRHGVFLAFLNTPFIGVLDKLRRSYSNCKRCIINRLDNTLFA